MNSLMLLPRGYRLGKQLYTAVRKGMGITEDFPDFMLMKYILIPCSTSTSNGDLKKVESMHKTFTPHEPSS